MGPTDRRAFVEMSQYRNPHSLGRADPMGTPQHPKFAECWGVSTSLGPLYRAHFHGLNVKRVQHDPGNMRVADPEKPEALRQVHGGR